MLESESRRITQKESCVLVAFGTPRRARSQRGKKKEKSARACSTPGRTCISLSYNEVKRGTFPTSLSHNVAKRGHGASFLTRAPRVKHMRVRLSQPLSKDQNSAIQEKKEETISSQLTPLKMLDLNAKQQRAGQRKIRDTTSQASMELTSLVSMLAFFERQSCTVATSPLSAAGTRSAVAFS